MRSNLVCTTTNQCIAHTIQLGIREQPIVIIMRCVVSHVWLFCHQCNKSFHGNCQLSYSIDLTRNMAEMTKYHIRLQIIGFTYLTAEIHGKVSNFPICRCCFLMKQFHAIFSFNKYFYDQVEKSIQKCQLKKSYGQNVYFHVKSLIFSSKKIAWLKWEISIERWIN